MAEQETSDEAFSFMEAWLDEHDKELENLYPGRILTGTVMEIRPDEVLIDIGAKAEGVVDSKELENLTDEERQQLQEGAEVRVYVVRPEGDEGHPILSVTRARMEQDWEFAEQQRAEDGIFEAQVAGVNKGGLIVHVGQVRGFVPSSQVASVRRRGGEANDAYQSRLSALVGEALKFKVLEVDRRRNRLILSERAAERERRRDQKEKLLDSLEEGMVIRGEITNLADFGAFADLGGADGLIHLSELSWSRVEHPSEVVKVGDEVDVYVLNVDQERRRIGLSLKRLQPEPWEEFLANHEAGDQVEATITKILDFGAFARLKGYDIEGLIHISELSDEHIERPQDVVQEGDEVTARILRLEPERKRLALSLRSDDASNEDASESGDTTDSEWTDETDEQE
ncbi:MAG: S1 RNA-binding domain-containing protein [Chloroflexota bacterium]|nr:S1 RNA-binding domain-containing protein [Chloroflexota bacterium]